MKKFLSLVLALVMTMSLVTVASATDFADDASINYDEAVSVIEALGIVGGYADDTFRPTNTLTRGAAAKIICNLLLTPAVADTLEATAAPFKDVPADSTFAAYIAYCSQEGIINGYADGTFRPSGTLTTNAFMKMLLGALGFDSSIEGYTGANWGIQVAKRVSALKLAAGNSAYVGTKAVTREEACLYAFNMLNTNLYGYSSKGTQITINGAVIASGASEAAPVTPATTFAAQNFTKLTSVAGGVDGAFGAPSTEWYLNGKKIGTFAIAPVLTYTTPVNQKTIYADLGLTGNATTASAVIWNNGTEGASAQIASKTGTANVGAAGYGVVTNVYKQVSGDVTTYTVNQIVPSFGEVVVTTKAATKTAGAYTQYVVGGNTAKVFSSIVDAETDIDTATVTGTVANKDKVLYYKDAVTGMLYIEAVDTLTGTLSAISNKGVLTIDGAAYNKAATGAAVSAAKTAQTFYVDSYNNVIQATAAVDNTKTALVLSKDYATALVDGKLKTTYTVDVVATDGTVSTLTLADETAYNAATAGVVLTYTTNTKGVSTLGAAAGDDLTAITTKSSALTGASLLANANTKFYFVNWTKDENDKDVVTGTLTTYTGINNVPSFTGLTKAYAVDTTTGGDGVADVVYIYDNKAASVNDTYVYVTGTYAQTADGYVIDVIVKGEATTLTTTELVGAGLYAKLTVGSDGKFTAKDAATGAVKYVKNNGNLLFTSADGETWTYASASVANDAPVYYINTTDGVATTAAADGLTAGVAGDNIYVVTKDAAVVSIYVLAA